MERSTKKGFRILFLIPIKDQRSLTLAGKLGFRVSKKYRCIITELDLKRRSL